MKLGRLLVLALAMLLSVGVSAGAEAKSKLFSKGKDAPQPEAGPSLETRLGRLEVQNEILFKDHPPQPETYHFRQNLAQAKKALKDGKREEAEKLIVESETWIVDARGKLYRDHESRVVVSADDDYMADLLGDVNRFSQKARAASQAKDDYVAGLYYAAALEQGELYLTVTQQKPDLADDMVIVAMQMEEIIKITQGPEKTKEFRERMIGMLDRSIMDLDRWIKNCISSAIPECTRYAVGGDKEYLERLSKKMDEKNQTLIRITADAASYEPSRYQAVNHVNMIGDWHENWAIYLKKGPKRDLELAAKEKESREQKAAIYEHSKLATGAAPAEILKLEILELDSYAKDDQVVVRGQVRNTTGQTLLNPQITIYGPIMSEVLDLGQKRFEPRAEATFTLTVKGFTAADLDQNGELPPHSFLLIYQDTEGKEHKVQQTIRP